MTHSDQDVSPSPTLVLEDGGRMPEPRLTFAQKHLPPILTALSIAVIMWGASIAVLVPQLTAGQSRIEARMDKLEEKRETDKKELFAQLGDTQKMIYDIYKGYPIVNPATKRGKR
jgi:hypothetical protein